MKSSKQPLISRDEVFVDTETTGLNPMLHEVVEFAGIKRDCQGNIKARLGLLLRAQYVTAPPPWAHALPGFNLEAWSQGIQAAFRVTGFTVEGVSNEHRMPPKQAATMIVEFLKNCTIIGQNVAFDMGFLKSLLEREGIDPSVLPYQTVDTITLAYEHLIPKGINSLSLTKPGGVCEFLNIPIVGAHSAMGDAEMTMLVYDKLTKKD